MTAHTRIQAAEKAVATGHLNAVTARSDSDHEAAVELERRKLLTETREQLEREIREDIAAEIAAVRTANWYEQPHDVLAVALREGMRRALRIVLGDGQPDRPRSRESVCRARRLPDLRRIVQERPGTWQSDRVRSVLWPDAVSERDALGLLDALTAEGVLVRDAARARWAVPEVQAVIDAERSRLNCERCGFDVPARAIGDEALCWGCKAAVSDGRREERPGEDAALRMLTKLRDSTGFAPDDRTDGAL